MTPTPHLCTHALTHSQTLSLISFLSHLSHLGVRGEAEALASRLLSGEAVGSPPDSEVVLDMLRRTSGPERRRGKVIMEKQVIEGQ